MPSASRSFGPVLPTLTLWHREIVRFYRQPGRVFGAIGQPLIFWVLFGAGLGASFRPSAAGQELSYMEYFFPGTLALILLFTAIFASISIIEDRNEGFLQAVLVAPVGRSVIVLGKVLGGTSLAVLQSCLFLLLGPLIGISFSLTSILATVGVLWLVGFGLTALGFAIAWGTESVQGFHAFMSVLLLPMWLLSGAFFPASGVPAWLGFVMAANPLTYGVEALRQALYISSGTASGLGFNLAMTLLFDCAIFGLATWMATRRVKGKTVVEARERD